MYTIKLFLIKIYQKNQIFDENIPKKSGTETGKNQK
jgi:hypothetical protein